MIYVLQFSLLALYLIAVSIIIATLTSVDSNEKVDSKKLGFLYASLASNLLLFLCLSVITFIHFKNKDSKRVEFLVSVIFLILSTSLIGFIIGKAKDSYNFPSYTRTLLGVATIFTFFSSVFVVTFLKREKLPPSEGAVNITDPIEEAPFESKFKGIRIGFGTI